MKNIVIIGAGDLGKELVWLIEDINKVKPTYVILGFLDDDIGKINKEFFGYKVLGTTASLEELNLKFPLSAVIAIRDGVARKVIVDAHPDFAHWETILHPTAVIAPESVLGEGTIMFPHVTVSVDTRIGRFGILYINATVCNDCVVGDFTSIMTGAVVSEHVTLESGTILNTGAYISPHTKYPEFADNKSGTGDTEKQEDL